MIISLRAFRLFHSEQQQALVGAIGAGVNRLRYHRAGMGRKRGNRFCNSNAGVGAERIQNCFTGTGRHDCRLEDEQSRFSQVCRLSANA